MEDWEEIDPESNKVIELLGMYAEEIKFFFQRDTWHKNEASFIFVGILPIKYQPLGYPKLNGNLIRENEKDELIDRGSMYLKLWESNPTNPEIAPPVEFIKWALSKKIKLPWLSFAIEHGFLPACVIEDKLKQNYDKSVLEHYLLYDLWDVKNALSVLCGLDYTFYSGTPNPEMLEFHLNKEPDKEAIKTLCRKEYRLKDLWDANGKGFDYIDTPAYFIGWALSKRFRPDWLDWAIERDLYTPKQGTETTPQPEAKRPVNSDFQPTKWRKAFEYESVGLNALYDLIESHYFDAGGNPIYDPAQLPLKKSLKSEWLTGRTRDEADTIITSGQRKGKAEK